MLNHHDRFTTQDPSAQSPVDRRLIDITYSERYIASAKCSACGQLFATSAVALGGSDDTERELVGAFGNHECASALKSAP